MKIYKAAYKRHGKKRETLLLSRYVDWSIDENFLKSIKEPTYSIPTEPMKKKK